MTVEAGVTFEEFSQGVVLETRGQGLVMLLTCLRCGAAVIAQGPVDDTPMRHLVWHEENKHLMELRRPW